MKIIESIENSLKFDNGLYIKGSHEQDCCEYNYLDFEQLPIGTELDDLTLGELIDAISLKDDGFSINDKSGTPKWVQARSSQYGFYSNRIGLKIGNGIHNIILNKGCSDYPSEIFEGEENE
ncbi:MAG: hypothetical protein KBC44_03315 [Candidatus Pacebacteria bacterium]|nr:hypothetical protein [Candidatus Paceibacterota bacterium]